MKIPKQTDMKVRSYALMTNDLDFNVELPFEAELIRNFAEVGPYTQVVFDGNTINYGFMIEKIASSANSKRLTFRILPKTSRFIIGSDSSQQRGEVVLL